MTRRQPHEYNWDKLEFDERILSKHFTKFNGKRKIEFFVIHHMIIPNRDMNTPDALTACYNVWQSRPASAHYGVDGDFIGQFVYDNDIAWANGNTDANKRSIAIEHANATLDQPGTDNDYVIDERTFYNGARLVAHLHKYYGLTPLRNVTVRQHAHFNATACPGPYMQRHFDRYFNLVVEIYNQIGTNKIDVPAEPKHSVPQPARLSDEAVAREVIQGVWGNGKERVDRLTAAGYQPARIQELVGKLIINRPQIDVRKLAQEVIQGKWGNGAVRQRRLVAAGYNAAAVQTEVNKILRGQ